MSPVDDCCCATATAAAAEDDDPDADVTDVADAVTAVGVREFQTRLRSLMDELDVVFCTGGAACAFRAQISAASV